MQFSKQVKNILNIIATQEKTAVQLKNLHDNAIRYKGITDAEREAIVEAIEQKLRATSPRIANKIFGARNRDTRIKLDEIFANLSQRYDLSKNGHKNSVKCGGNVISGDAYIYDYISYRNNESKMIAQMAFFQPSIKGELKLHVFKKNVGQDDQSCNDIVKYDGDQLEQACSQFEKYLSDVLV